MTVTPGSGRWKELVQEGIVRDGNRNWFLGDAALEIAPIGAVGRDNGRGDLLAQFADEVGVDAGSLRVYRQVAATWPKENRVSFTSWKVHQQLMNRKDLIKSGMTVSQAALALNHKNTGRTGPKAPVDQRAEAAADLLSDPEVARRVEDRARNYGRTETANQAAAPGPSLDELYNEAVLMTTRARRIAEYWAGQARQWDEDQRQLYMQEINEAYRLMAGLAQTEAGVDAELRRLLGTP